MCDRRLPVSVHARMGTIGDEKRTLIDAETTDLRRFYQRQSIQISGISVLFSGQTNRQRIAQKAFTNLFQIFHVFLHPVDPLNGVSARIIFRSVLHATGSATRDEKSPALHELRRLIVLFRLAWTVSAGDFFQGRRHDGLTAITTKIRTQITSRTQISQIFIRVNLAFPRHPRSISSRLGCSSFSTHPASTIRRGELIDKWVHFDYTPNNYAKA